MRDIVASRLPIVHGAPASRARRKWRRTTVCSKAVGSVSRIRRNLRRRESRPRTRPICRP